MLSTVDGSIINVRPLSSTRNTNQRNVSCLTRVSIIDVAQTTTGRREDRDFGRHLMTSIAGGTICSRHKKLHSELARKIRPSRHYRIRPHSCLTTKLHVRN